MVVQNPELMDNFKNKDYYNGYATEAKKMKSKKVWKSYGSGAVVSAVITILALAAIQ